MCVTPVASNPITLSSGRSRSRTQLRGGENEYNNNNKRKIARKCSSYPCISITYIHRYLPNIHNLRYIWSYILVFFHVSFLRRIIINVRVYVCLNCRRIPERKVRRCHRGEVHQARKIADQGP